MPLKRETYGIRKIAEDEAFKAYGSGCHAESQRNTFFSAFLKGAALHPCSHWEYGICKHCGEGMSPEVRAEFEDGEAESHEERRS